MVNQVIPVRLMNRNQSAAPRQPVNARAAEKLLRTLALSGGLLAQAAFAAPPPNDDFVDRIPLSGARVMVTGSNLDATLEPGEPIGGTFNSPPIEKTVWWTWTAPSDGGLAASVIGGDFLAVVNIHAGSSVSNLTLVSGDPWGPGGHPPHRTTARVTAGTAYQIAVGSVEGGSGTIALELAFVPRASNDDFVNRIVLGGGGARAEGSVFGATAEPVEWPFIPGSPYGTLWWSWTAAESGPVVLQVAGVTPAPGDLKFGFRARYTSLSVFVGDNLESLTLVTNRSASGEFAPPLSEVRLGAVSGTTYHVSAGGEPGHLGDIELAIARTTTPGVILTGPLNDVEFIAGSPIPMAAEAVDADGSVTGVEFFAGGPMYGAELRQADEARPFRGVLTNLPPDRYYLIARATDDSGIKSDSIPVEFNVRPVNDSFANRIAFSGAFGTVTGTLANASKEAGEPPELEQPSVWWAWTAPASALFTFTAAAASGAVLKLGVFTGTSLATLSAVPKAPGRPERAVIQAEAGVVYAIAISGASYLRACTLQVAQTEPPGITLLSPTNGTRIVEGNPVTFSAEATDPDGSISWVEFFNVFSSSFGLVSNAPFALMQSLPRGYYHVYAAATDNHGVVTRSEEVVLEVVPVPPANDAFASRIPFAGSFITVTGDTANATFETDEVDVGRDGSAWWEWTAPTTGDYSITVASSPGYQPWLAIYTGQATDSLILKTNSPFYSFDVSYSALVTIHALAGERYQIAAGSGAMVRVGVARTLPPTVTISNPENDAVFVVGETVEVRAEASDPDGTIDRVEIYRNSALFATLTNEPFVLAFPLTYPRYDRFQARALDNHGVAGISEEVRFLAREPGPANDAFSDRISFTGSFVSVTGSAVHATLEPGEGFWVEGGSAWWEWTAPASGMFTIGAQSVVGHWPSLAVMAGTELPGLILITNAAYRGEVPGYSAQVVVEAQAGAAYPIAVAVNGPVTLSVARTTPPAVALLQPAPNSVFRVGDTVVLQAEASDPDGSIESVEFFLNGQPFGTTTNEPFTLSSTFHEGNAGYNLRARATDDRGISTFSDTVYFEVRFRPPANDHFEDRTALQGWFITLEATDWEATREPGEPTPDNGPGSVWWRWKAPASGRAILSCDRSYAHLAACLGTNVAELSVVASTEQPASSGSQLEFDVIARADYAIVFQSLGGFAGTFRLSLVLDARELAGSRMLEPGLFAFDLRTTFERIWIVEATTNLLDWTPVWTNRWPGETLEFLDPAASGHPLRFYRAVGQW